MEYEDDELNSWERSLPTIPYDTPVYRAGCACKCPTCGKDYIAHQPVRVLGTDHLIVNLLCSGKYVKL